MARSFQSSYSPVRPLLDEELDDEILDFGSNQEMQEELAQDPGCMGGVVSCLGGGLDFIKSLFQCGGAEEEETGTSAYEERLASNNFRIGAGLQQYTYGFAPGFQDDLNGLGASSRWLDAGAGKAQAMRDLVADREQSGGEIPQMVATGFKRPEDEGLGTFMQEHQDTFSYPDGKFFGDLTDEELGLGPTGTENPFDLITDYNGVMLYTHTLSEDLERYLRSLKVGGAIHTTNFGSLTLQDDEDENFNLHSWLSQVQGVNLTRSPKNFNGYRIEKTSDETMVPGLDWIGGNDEHSPPQRTFRRRR